MRAIIDQKYLLEEEVEIVIQINGKKRVSFKSKIDSTEKEIYDNDFFSLRITESLYKKDIGKFLEILSSHFI